MSSTSQNKTGNIHRLALFHRTPIECAEIIISSQQFKKGGGLYGTGIYFANTYEATTLKTKHHPKSKWCVLVADVYIGNYIVFTKNDALQKKIDTNELLKKGFNTIFGVQMPTGREIVCLEESRVKNIRYVYGEKPNAVFQNVRPRITLFKTVSIAEARAIHKRQSFDKTDGPFGKGVYLFYTLTDAINNNKNGVTYLACDAKVSNPYHLRPNETLKTNRSHHNACKLYIGNYHNCPYYIFTDNKLISGIHYCGGKNWD